MKVIRVNDDKKKKVKWKCRFKNKLIVFIYYLKLFFILSYTIKLFYKIYTNSVFDNDFRKCL